MTGPQIKRGSPLWPSDADKPTGLRDGDYATLIAVLDDGREQSPSYDRMPDPNRWVWPSIVAIRLPADHPLSLAQTWNDAHENAPPFTAPWYGGKDVPGDYDGGPVLVQDSDGGCRVVNQALSANWQHGYGYAWIVAYRTRTTPAQPAASEGLPTYDPAVQVVLPKKVTDDMERAWRSAPGLSVQVAFDAMVAASPTPEETATAAKWGITVEAVRAIRDRAEEGL